MKRLFCILLSSLIMLSFIACSQTDNQSTPDIGHGSATMTSLDAKEALSLKHSHPDCFGIDVAEGLNVLVFENQTGEFRIRLVSGSITHWTSEEALKATRYKALTMDECKKMILFYGLSDEKVYLRPYQDPLSSYLMMVDESLANRIAEAFDNRYKVETVFASN